ncbi:MAG: hypothetical protein J0L89_11470 [Xanthomonadales bacterium]|nr:hypothetical protein [Xanthomonadaceae bacterium]MBN8225420.1 hypothetical protein [Xanthomonadales bacterium]MCA0197308.1 hypothetical protein [Pseudomonadota bacterium]HRF83858.1 hypothetical protein [Pseudoxanthomonas sp.]
MRTSEIWQWVFLIAVIGIPVLIGLTVAWMVFKAILYGDWSGGLARARSLLERHRRGDGYRRDPEGD